MVPSNQIEHLCNNVRQLQRLNRSYQRSNKSLLFLFLISLLVLFWNDLSIVTTDNSLNVIASSTSTGRTNNDRKKRNSKRKKFSQSTHTSNYALIVSTSKYWFNYRHNTNSVGLYTLLKEYGNFTDDNIILMLAGDDYSSNARNPYKNHIYHKPIQQQNTNKIFNPLTTQIDYRNDDVTVQNFINVLLGKKSFTTTSTTSSLPVFDKLNKYSNLLIYMTGHGGNEFFKFNDIEELLSNQLYNVLYEMYTLQKYNQILLISDTCQAYTMSTPILSKNNNNNNNIPNIIMIGSSLKDQSSYSHHSDPIIGLGLIEKYTYHFLEYIYNNDILLTKSIYSDLIEPYIGNNKKHLLQNSDIGYMDTIIQNQQNLSSSDNVVQSVHTIGIRDFFVNIEATEQDTSRKRKKHHNNNDNYSNNKNQRINSNHLDTTGNAATDATTTTRMITLQPMMFVDNNIPVHVQQQQQHQTIGTCSGTSTISDDTCSSSSSSNSSSTTPISSHGKEKFIAGSDEEQRQQQNFLFGTVLIGFLSTIYILGKYV